MHTTLRERFETRVKWQRRVKAVGQVLGYGLAGFAVTAAVWLYLMGLLGNAFANILVSMMMVGGGQ